MSFWCIGKILSLLDSKEESWTLMMFNLKELNSRRRIRTNKTLKETVQLFKYLPKEISRSEVEVCDETMRTLI